MYSLHAPLEVSMSKELVISANRHETRVAVVEDDQVVEVYHQRENEYSLAGSIHKGRVTRVLPGMQSAFVDIGLDRDAFLYVSDFFEDNEEYDKIVTSVEDKVLKLDRLPLAVPVAALPPVASPPAEVPEPVDVRSASPEAGPPITESAVPAVPAAPSAPLSAPSQEQRRDDRERRGRRSRRRRGQKTGGRSLPDSKFYSPGARNAPENEPAARVNPPEPATASTPAPAVVVPREETADDFFVLPGESLAKYTRPGSEEEDEDRPGQGAFEAAPEDSGFEDEEGENRPPTAEAGETASTSESAGPAVVWPVLPTAQANSFSASDPTGHAPDPHHTEAAAGPDSEIVAEPLAELQPELPVFAATPVTMAEIRAEPPGG